MTKALITRPRYDEATIHTFSWSSLILDTLKSLGYETKTLSSQEVTPQTLTSTITSFNPSLYIHFGHGCPASLVGQNTCIITNGTSNYPQSLDMHYLSTCSYRMYDDILCDALCNIESNVQLLSNKIVIAYSCHSAKRLGVCAMKSGAKAYIGYNDYLIFMVDTLDTEKIFMDCFHTPTLSLLNGDTLLEAKQKTLSKYDYYINKYNDVQYLKNLLLWDKNAFTVLGNENLTLFR